MIRYTKRYRKVLFFFWFYFPSFIAFIFRIYFVAFISKTAFDNNHHDIVLKKKMHRKLWLFLFVVDYPQIYIYIYIYIYHIVNPELFYRVNQSFCASILLFLQCSFTVLYKTYNYPEVYWYNLYSNRKKSSAVIFYIFSQQANFYAGRMRISNSNSHITPSGVKSCGR